jgi:O-succinylhomoserine sulfhydrylase
VDGTDLAQWRAAIRPGTKAVFFETVSNPTLEVIDVKAVADLAHAQGALVIADNVFATPVFSRAIELGADVVVYSTTKHVDGQGRALGGIVLGTKQFVRKTLEPFVKHTGGAMSPFTAWIMLKGLETMDLRVRAQATTALALAQSLEGHPGLVRVIYPGLASHPQHAVAMEQTGSGGTVLSIDVGSREAAFRFLNALEIFTISNNLGDAKSIATHPASTTHQRLPQDQKDRLGITPGLVRLSCGIEDSEDLLKDLLGALDAAEGSQAARDAAE